MFLNKKVLVSFLIFCVFSVGTYLFWDYIQALKDRNSINAWVAEQSVTMSKEKQVIPANVEKEVGVDTYATEDAVSASPTTAKSAYNYTVARNRISECCLVPEESLVFFETKADSAKSQREDNESWLTQAKAQPTPIICVVEWQALLDATQSTITVARSLEAIIRINDAGAREIKSEAAGLIQRIDVVNFPSSTSIETFITTSTSRLKTFTADINTAADTFNAKIAAKNTAYQAVSACLAQYTN